ncbi:MAG: hypothetical protein CUN55_07320 [Phototrophicales bacterium]|nr:MAG: hypothetical protein CUN55_07320 [Phototrophicales bacterium]
MEYAWLVFYQMPEGIHYTHGWGQLSELPRIPNGTIPEYFEIQWHHINIQCIYDTQITKENALFLAQAICEDGIFDN